MIRFLISLFLGLLLGLGLGLYLGWYQFPLEYTDSPTTALSQHYKDEYMLMIASGYLADGDFNGAFQRLSVLGSESVSENVRQTIERFIANSRDVGDIRSLVALYQGLTGSITPLMEPYRQVSVPGQSP